MPQLTRPRPGAHRAPSTGSTAVSAPGRAVPADAGHRRLARRAVRATGNLLLLLVLAAFAGLAVGPHVLGYRTMTMLTGSMSPGINPGDVTVAVPEPVSELAVGQVISYHIPVDDHRVVSHRVTEVRHLADGSVQVRTKGDNNPGVDPWTAIITDEHVWRVRAVVPRLGTVVQTLRGPGMRVAFLYVGPAVLALLLLADIWRGPRRRPEPAGPAGRAVTDEAAATLLEPQALRSLGEELDGAGCLREFLLRWCDLLPARIGRIEGALTRGHVSAAHEATLSLQVTSSMIGLTALARATAELEHHLLLEDIAAADAAFVQVRRLGRASARALRRHPSARPSRARTGRRTR
jgi:signal peptidase I